MRPLGALSPPKSGFIFYELRGIFSLARFANPKAREPVLAGPAGCGDLSEAERVARSPKVF